MLDLHCGISAIYYNKKFHCYSEKKADSYFNAWKEAATIYQNSQQPLFSPLFIHLKSYSRICPCQCEMKPQGWLQNWHETALGVQSQKSLFLLPDLVGNSSCRHWNLLTSEPGTFKGASSSLFSTDMSWSQKSAFCHPDSEFSTEEITWVSKPTLLHSN